jgi:ribA/ribD-fused uncharacterized protein
MNNEEFHFFWKGPLSQWFKRDFIVEGVKYCTAEQYMMASKAILFNDKLAHKKIMEATNPYDQKAYGRNVEDFDVGKWQAVSKEIVFKGNYEKFTQHDDFKCLILSTGTKTLVEASPHDKLWGIGLSEDDPRALDRATWLGRNWLGEVLTNVREQIRKEII